MKRNAAFLGILIMFAVILAGCGNYKSMSATMMSQRSRADGWMFSARTANGHSTRTLSFSSANLASLHVENTNSGGGVFLIMTQNNIERTVDITGAFNGNIDMSDFEPGRIRLRLSFEKAQGVNVVMSW